MKKIYSLYIANLNNKQHFSYMELAVAACTLYAIISEEFRRLYEALLAAFRHEDDMFIHHDREEISRRLKEAETNRIRLFRHLRDFIKTYETCEPGAKKTAADILMNIIGSYGGGDIPSQKVDERSASISNLVEDLEKDYPAQVAELGCAAIVTALKEANQAYLDILTERSQFDAENGMALLATARKRTDAAYHALVEAVNAAATVDKDGELTPYIDYMNVNVRRYRGYVGQSTADMDGTTSSGSSGSDSGVTLKNATFEFKNGNSQKFRLEPGVAMPVVPNTEGYIWKPEVMAFMPNRNIIFREVPIDDKEATATFHYLDHTEEEIRQIVGSILTAPANTAGCVWVPEVPATMPAEDTSYYEQQVSSGGGTGGEEQEPTKYWLTLKFADNTQEDAEYAEGATITYPTPTTGYRWPASAPTVMPAHDVTVTEERNPNQPPPATGGGESGFD